MRYVIIFWLMLVALASARSVAWASDAGLEGFRAELMKACGKPCRSVSAHSRTPNRLPACRLNPDMSAIL